jgi:hypothetical protein
MGFYRGPHTVTDGLVLSLDAGNTKSYQSGSTTWFDKSGNNRNGTLTNGPTFSSGSIVFDGVDDYVDITGSLSTFSFIQNTGIFTVSAWIRLTDLAGGARYFIGNNRNSGTEKGFNIGYSGASGRLRYALTDGAVSILVVNADNYFLDSSWIFSTLVGNGTNSILYKNGIQFSVSSNFGTLSTGDSTRALAIGKANDISILEWQGNISQVSIYNRALTAQEVLQNYNATKSRFNL